MDPLDSAQSAYVLISLASIPLLLLSLIPHLVRSNHSGISRSARLSVPTVSLGIWTILKSASTIFDRYVLLKRVDNDLFCNIDAILIAALTTGMAAHIPAIALYRYRAIPTPAIPSPPIPTKARNLVCLILIYAYSFLPCVPTLSRAIAGGSGTPQSLTRWWGFYCIDTGNWFRTVRPLTLLAPLILTLPIVVLIFSVLYSTSGHPSPHIRPSGRSWAQGIILLFAAVVVGAYLIIEQVIGWNDSWWPRSLEGLAGPILALSLLFDTNIWRTYSYWVRLRGPPIPESTPPTPLLSNSEWSLNTPQSDMTYNVKRTSSFYAPKIEGPVPALVSKRSVRFPPTPQQVEFIPDNQIAKTDRDGGRRGGSRKGRNKIESLLPPPAKRKSLKGLLKPSMQSTSQDETSRLKTHVDPNAMLEEERHTHPHPHSTKDTISPPMQLMVSEMVNTIPQVVVQEPTPVYYSKYSSGASTSRSPPFQYQDLVTVYSTDPARYAPGAGADVHYLQDIDSMNSTRSGAGRHDEYTLKTADTMYTDVSKVSKPFRDTYDTTLAYTVDREHLSENDVPSRSSTQRSSKPGLGELITTIGRRPQPSQKPERIPSVRMPEPISSPEPAQEPERGYVADDTSSIYSQPSMVGSFYGSAKRPSLVHTRNASTFSGSNLSYAGSGRMMVPTPEEEEVISFPVPAGIYQYGEETEGFPERNKRI
ncbi:uncharacterized protein I303_106597 [Kwoniella dejecticola CBS 10117]|uniref:Uncharacterized protein n=1 Tax=Kwoniella dejecticola CBS 10117 TaxID=1296121 RepID=A0A1A5ZU94_9TREE|nr:uncharacterized protein I303_08146 [Kwoniella dejecticola CBS 10117]OBR81376.1 hypothetical protein I303_08146 [Kwoniella dejecticola CBS 10117]